MTKRGIISTLAEQGDINTVITQLVFFQKEYEGLKTDNISIAHTKGELGIANQPKDACRELTAAIELLKQKVLSTEYRLVRFKKALAELGE